MTPPMTVRPDRETWDKNLNILYDLTRNLQSMPPHEHAPRCGNVGLLLKHMHEHAQKDLPCDGHRAEVREKIVVVLKELCEDIERLGNARRVNVEAGGQLEQELAEAQERWHTHASSLIQWSSALWESREESFQWQVEAIRAHLKVMVVIGDGIPGIEPSVKGYSAVRTQVTAVLKQLEKDLELLKAAKQTAVEVRAAG